MTKYRITAATPKGAAHHLNSQFKVYEYKKVEEGWSWRLIGWKSIYDIANLLNAGHEVLTGKVEGGKMATGDAVEIELRIAHNGTNYKISGMPDK